MNKGLEAKIDALDDKNAIYVVQKLTEAVFIRRPEPTFQTMAQVMYQGTPAPRTVETSSGRIRFWPRTRAATASPNVTTAARTMAMRFMRRTRSGGR